MSHERDLQYLYLTTAAAVGAAAERCPLVVEDSQDWRLYGVMMQALRRLRWMGHKVMYVCLYELFDDDLNGSWSESVHVSPGESEAEGEGEGERKGERKGEKMGEGEGREKGLGGRGSRKQDMS
jgi:hypothetical protein